MLSQIQFGPANPDNPFQEEWREVLRETCGFRNLESNPKPWKLARRDTISFVISEVSVVADIPAAVLRSPYNGNRKAVMWRQLGMHICKHKLRKSHRKIAEAFGYAHHGSVSHGLARAEKLLQDPKRRAEYDRVVREVG